MIQKVFFGSLSPKWLSICTVGNMGVVICLGQGGLRSLSASSLHYHFFALKVFFLCIALVYASIMYCGIHMFTVTKTCVKEL